MIRVENKSGYYRVTELEEGFQEERSIRSSIKVAKRQSFLRKVLHCAL